MLLSIDIETACGVGCTTKCDHALDPFRSHITCVGTYYEDTSGLAHSCVYRHLRDFSAFINGGTFRLTGYNLKFDLKTLAAHGVSLEHLWEDDAMLMAVAYTEKASDEYIAGYEAKRKELNALLPHGVAHRPAGQYTLKVTAPYFLGVEPFWETPLNHDNDEYVLKDCAYAYKLTRFLEQKLKDEGTHEFYATKLLPWAKMLLSMEQKGISLDLEEMDKADIEAQARAEEARGKLNVLWREAFDAWALLQRTRIEDGYAQKAAAALAKLKTPTPEKESATRTRYKAMSDKAVAKLGPLNLDSPAQLTWLLRDHLNLDITDFDGEETTGKAVLQKLSSQGREDVATFLAYRKAKKLTQAFFPSYREMQVKGAIHCNFNPAGTRTGRLSSSSPNLQQVERGLHSLFIARPHYKLATFDMSAIEPRLIAYYSDDANLYNIVSQGLDFHGYNTRIFFELDCDIGDIKKQYPKEREVGKEVALALMYGAGTTRLQESAQKRGFVWSKRECQKKLERFKHFYQGVYRYREQVVNPALLAGEPIVNILGRAFRIPAAGNVHMQGLNTLIQGSASDLVVHSAYRIGQRFKEAGIDGHVLLLVHDEIVTEIPEERDDEAVAIIKDAMTSYQLDTAHGRVPLEVEGNVSATWTK